jgi:hypothetical protein
MSIKKLRLGKAEPAMAIVNSLKKLVVVIVLIISSGSSELAGA